MLSHPHEMPVYARLPFAPSRGAGCRLWNDAGDEFVDLYGGHAVASTGHAHPRVVAAIRDQAQQLLFYSNALPLAVRDRFVSALVDLLPAGLDRVFLVNSGTEANEQAVALARRSRGRSKVVAFEGGFHGRSLAALALSGIPRYRELARCGGAGSHLLEQTVVVPFDDPGALEAAVDPDTAAVLIEPIQGLAGARDASLELLTTAREICDRHGACLIFDEVQAGIGRTGAFTAAQIYGVTPDLLTLAKGIASGLPLSAVVACPAIADELRVGDLGSTFGGGPIPCAAAEATLAVIRDEDLAGNASAREIQLRGSLSDHAAVRDIRGRGLLLGIELDRPAQTVRRGLFDRGYLVGSSIEPNTLRLLPPLNIDAATVGGFVEAFAQAVEIAP